MELQDIDTLKLLLIIGVLSTSLLAIIIITFIVFHQRKLLLKESELIIIEQEKELELIKVSMEAGEKEREKIANNLHDEINPMLSLLKFNIGRYRLEFKKNKFNPDSFFSDEKIIDKTIEGLRSISMDLSPSYLLQNGMLSAIEDYIGQFKRSNHIKVVLINTVSDDWIELLDNNKQLHIYRMWLELFHNICKHTFCNEIKINLSCESDMLKITFCHDGTGISDEQINLYSDSSTGLGLKSLKARSVLLNAKVNYITNKSYPYIHLNIPINQ